MGKPKLKEESFLWQVSALPRPEFDGFRRGGMFFPNAPLFVELEELTSEIENEPMLIKALVTPASDEKADALTESTELPKPQQSDENRN